MSKSRILFYLLSSFVGGIFACSFFEINQSVCFLILILSLIILFVFYKSPLIVVGVFVSIFFIFGLWKTDGALQKANDLPYVDNFFQGEALVLKSSDSSFGQNVIVEFLSDEDVDSKADMLISVPKYPQYKYGDLLKLSCTVKAIENVDPEFDYRMYMAKENVFYKCEKPEIMIIGENNGNFLYQKVLQIRNAFEEKILQAIPEPQAALAKGLLFGGSSGLPKEIQKDFSKTGMTHIVAVSGYNVTIIAEYLIILGIALGFWRKQAIWFALIGIILFVIMSGLPASAVRAGVMGGTLLWAMKNGRLASSENAILFAAAIMLFLNPLLLRWDIGFQLSFLATLGIIIISPLWEKSFVKKHKALGISEAIMLSLSAQIFVLPIIAYNFHIASLISLLANIFILPIIPLSMLLVFLVPLTGFIFAPLSMIFAWLAYLPLLYEIKLIHILAEFPWASIEIEKVNAWWIVLYYLMLIIIIIQIKNRQKYARIKIEEEIFYNDILANRRKKGK